jgi:hypothetical protein
MNVTEVTRIAQKEDVKEVARVAPVVSGNAQVKYLNRNTRTNVMGTSITYTG